MNKFYLFPFNFPTPFNSPTTPEKSSSFSDKFTFGFLCLVLTFLYALRSFID